MKKLIKTINTWCAFVIIFGIFVFLGTIFEGNLIGFIALFASLTLALLFQCLSAIIQLLDEINKK